MDNEKIYKKLIAMHEDINESSVRSRVNASDITNMKVDITEIKSDHKWAFRGALTTICGGFFLLLKRIMF